ncbi:MAG: leucine-rich repeat domain-containing protein [Eubacterium sp.]|nr:leucine-rich repeat domain-containing protein [Eubacterium sp.]
MENKGKTAVEQRFAPAVKKILSLLLAAAMLFSIAAGIELSAYAATSGDYEYEILDDGTVEITEYSGSAKNLAIPGTIAGKTVSRIGDLAFSGCETLTNVTIPSSVTSLGDGVFFCCESLKSITVDANNKNYLSADGVLYNKNKTKLIVYPIQKADTAFAIPNSVSIIDEAAFFLCGNLTKVTIPNSVKTISDAAFAYCGGLKNVTIPNSVATIGEAAFSGCANLESITIPGSVTSIGEGAFLECESLASVTVDSNNKSYSSVDGVLYNENKTQLIIYPAAKTTASFTIPNSVTSIAEAAFFSCESLTKVTIPGSVKSIGYGAFACTGLTSVTIPNSVTNIDELAFGGCLDLKSITINNKNTKIGDSAIDEYTTIYGYKGSTAESYAKEYGNKFVALTQLSTPTLKVTVNTNGTFKLSWNKVSGAEKYELYIKQADGSYKLMKTTTGTSFTTAVAAYGKQYSYKMKAVKGSTKSSYSNTVNATNNKKLQTPTLKAIVNANGTFKLSWNKVAGADKYELYIKQADGSYKLMKTTTATSFTTAFATYGKQFSYKMRAVNSKNKSLTSAYSSVVNATNNKKLQTPTMKASVNANGTFKLSWNKVAGADKYELYIKQANGSYKLMKTTTATSFTTAFATYGKQFSYKMRAVNSKNSSAASSYSAVVNAKNTKKLQKPAMKVTVNTNGSFKLSWNKVEGATSYQLYIKQANGSYKLMKTTTSTSFTTAVATKGKTYSYKMVAVTSKNKNATSNYSNVVNAKRK